MANQFINAMTALWNSAGTTYAGIKMNVTNAASAVGSKLIQMQIGGVDVFSVDKTGALTTTGAITSAGVTSSAASLPSANDSAALGSATASWSDLFLASGGVINWANGDVTATHALNTLTFAGGASYQFDNPLIPTASVALGQPTTAWSSLYLGSGGTINFANGNATLTHTVSGNVYFGGAGGSFGCNPDGSSSLGATGFAWSNLFMKSGGAFVWGVSNVTLSHSAGMLTLLGTADFRVTTAGTNTQSVVTVGGAQTLTNKTLSNPTMNQVTTAGDNITVTMTDASAAVGPSLYLERNSSSPATNDFIARVVWRGRDDGGGTEDYAEIWTQIMDPVAGSEDATMSFRRKVAGVMQTAFTVDSTGLVAQTGDIRVPTAGTTSQSVVTIGGTQILSNKTMTTTTLTSPSIDGTGLQMGNTTSINWNSGDVVLGHTFGAPGFLTLSTGDLRVSFAGTTSSSVVTNGGTQTLTNKTLTNPTINAATLTGTLSGGLFTSTSIQTPTISGTPSAASATWSNLGAVTTIDINGGTIDGTSIGSATPAAGTFSVLTTTASLVPSVAGAVSVGTSALPFAHLQLASAGTLNFANGNWLATHSSGVLTVTTGELRVPTPGSNTNSVVTIGATQSISNKTLNSPVLSGTITSENFLPTTNNAYTLGSTSFAWANLYLASGGNINWGNGNAILTHTTGVLSLSTGDLRVTGPGSNTASVVTVGGNQTLTGKTLTSPTINGGSSSGVQFTSAIDITSATAGQISFPATQNPSGNANTLDDYKEATFSPIIAFAGASVGVVYASQAGSYTKIGNRVFFSLSVTISSKGTSTGQFQVGGLPIATGGSPTMAIAFSVGTSTGFTGLTGVLCTSCQNGQTLFSILQTGASGGNVVVTDANVTNAASITVFGHYQV